MLTVAKWLLMISGVLLMLDSLMMALGKPNPLFGWPLPCPITLFLLGMGTLLLGLSSKAFTNSEKDSK